MAHGRIIRPVGDDVLNRGLHLGVERGEHRVAAVAQLGLHGAAVGRVVLQPLHAQHLGDDIVDRIFDIIGVVVHRVGAGRRGLKHGERVVDGGVVLLLRDHLLVEHLAEHIVDARVQRLYIAASIIAAAGIVPRGISDHARQRGALAQRQLVEVLPEVVQRRDAHAVARAAQVDDVQVGFEDLLLAQLLFDLDGQIRLLHLALVVLVAGEHGQLHQLAGQRRGALRIAAHHVVDDGADLALDVNSVVLEKARVLDRNHGVDEVFGNLVDFDVDSVLRAAEFRDQIALAVVDKRRLRLSADGLEVEVGRRIDPRLGDADDQSRAGQADQKHDEEQHPHRHKDDREQEVLLRLARFEDRVFPAHDSSVSLNLRLRRARAPAFLHFLL